MTGQEPWCEARMGGASRPRQASQNEEGDNRSVLTRFYLWGWLFRNLERKGNSHSHGTTKQDRPIQAGSDSLILKFG